MRTLLCGLALWAAALAPLTGRAEAPRARADYTAAPPRIDGLLDDVAWRGATAHGGFVERRPRLGAVPPEETTFFVLYDEEALYFGVRCVDSRPGEVRALTLQRDSFTMFQDDAISIKLDPQSDRRTTIGLVLNPAGAQLDYRGINESEFRAEFDAIWQGSARRTSFGWSAELRVPWASLGIDPRRPPARVGLNLSRDHSRRNATYDWSLTPPPFSPIAASRYGDLLGLDELPRRSARKGQGGPNYALIPYALLGFRQDGGTNSVLGNAGLDARLEQGDRLSLQLTLNTDFAQVDLDDQRINLGRFGLFFPEKRDFFLRDLELFRFGRPAEAELLQTRRIGLRSGEAVPILDAMKLLGRPRPWLRLGLLQATTTPASGAPWTLYLVGRAQAELGRGGSNVGVMLTHRQSLVSAADRNLVVGIDGAWRSAGALLLSGYGLLSLTGPAAAEVAEAAGGPGTAGHPAPGAGAEVSWRGLLLRPRVRYAYYHPDLRTDLGFFRRVGVHDASGALGVEPRIQRRGLERLSTAAYAGLVGDGAGTRGVLDWWAGASAELFWNIGFAMGAAGEWREETVLSSFRIGRGTEISPGRYGVSWLGAWANTPSVWRVNGGAGFSYRSYYGGDQYAVELRVQARPFSLLRAEVGADLSRIDFPDERGTLYTAAINGRLALGFTPRLGLDGFVAWNNVADLVRLQARLRYRYSEGSDLFVVFQQDLSGAGGSRFLSALVKLTLRLPEGATARGEQGRDLPHESQAAADRSVSRGLL